LFSTRILVWDDTRSLFIVNKTFELNVSEWTMYMQLIKEVNINCFQVECARPRTRSSDIELRTSCCEGHCFGDVFLNCGVNVKILGESCLRMQTVTFSFRRRIQWNPESWAYFRCTEQDKFNFPQLSKLRVFSK
jgi:hypothetical protein